MIMEWDFIVRKIQIWQKNGVLVLIITVMQINTARRQYFDVERNRRQKDDLYITTILNEEMTANDPRIR